MPANKRDYYEVLGVGRAATPDEIKRAYRRLAKKFHPDQNKGDKDAETRFKEVQEAYDVLSEPEKRTAYDQFGHAGAPRGGPHVHAGPGNVRWYSHGGGQPPGAEDLEDLFDFGFFGGQRGGTRGGSTGSPFEEFLRRSGARAGDAAAHEPNHAQDIEQSIALTFEQAVRGTTLELTYVAGSGKRQTISVRIQPGVRDGQRIRVKGKGQPAHGRRPAGDLYVICNVQPHPWFKRIEDDIYLEVPVSITEATLGAGVDIPTLEGVRTVKIPPGTASGRKLRLTGLGVPNTRTGQRGDQYAVIKIVPPEQLSNRQKELLEELHQSGLRAPREGLWK